MQGVESVWDGYMKTSINVEHAVKALPVLLKEQKTLAPFTWASKLVSENICCVNAASMAAVWQLAKRSRKFSLRTRQKIVTSFKEEDYKQIFRKNRSEQVRPLALFSRVMWSHSSNLYVEILPKSNEFQRKLTVSRIREFWQRQRWLQDSLLPVTASRWVRIENGLLWASFRQQRIVLYVLKQWLLSLSR